MSKESAGLLIYRLKNARLEFLLVHPGGPFWKHKEKGAWTIPKGEIVPGEEPLVAAKREFREELGFEVTGPTTALGSIRQKGGKVVQAWAVNADVNFVSALSNEFEMEWPPGSGNVQKF